MQIRVTTDNNITGSEGLTSHVEGVVADVLGRFSQRLTRVEVHLADENSRAKSGENDKRCTMEARPRGLKPIAVTQQAATIDQAIDAAADTLAKSLDRTLERLDDRKRQSYGGDGRV
ncbi:MAG TPA: HPF/RaiA family ribosome-associated protein [Lacipirellulaceae bacterium]